MNTTRLIGQWSMDGARADLRHGFRSAVDIVAVLSGATTEAPLLAVEVVASDGLLVKPAGGDDWQPLLAGPA
jgi:hypothetical protein